MSTGSPLVSVVTPFLNAGRFIAEAIDSVLAQTYTNWELLLVDDGSSDESRAIALACSGREPAKIRYLQHPGRMNRGSSASRNLALANAAGEYIAFLDADDVWLPEKLEYQVGILESHPQVGMLYGPTMYWYSWNADEDRQDLVHETRILPGTILSPPDALRLYLTRAAPVPCMGAVLVTRAVVSQVGGFEDSFPGMHDDQVFYAKVCLAAPVLVDGPVLDRYRRHAQSCYSVAKATGQEEPAESMYLDWLQQYLRAKGLERTEVWRDLQTARSRFHSRVSRSRRRSFARHAVRRIRGLT